MKTSSTSSKSAEALATGPSPEELARRAQNGSLAAFTQLVAEFEGRLFNFILRRAGNWADAEELTQETFVRAWERIDRYDDRWRFSTWLFTIGSRLTVSHHRARRKTVSYDAAFDRAASTRSVEEIASAAESGSPTWKLAQELLSESQRTALWLRYAEDLSIREIACIMSKSQVSIRVSLFRARDQLAQEILRIRAQDEARRGAVAAATSSAGMESLDLELLAARRVGS